MALLYPFAPPLLRHTVEVAAGVRWIRLSMPFKLDHINVWSIDTPDGWILVDTGLNAPDTVADWLALTEQGPLSRPLQGVYATHMHPDHIGLAGWFTRRTGVPLHMSRLEYLSCRVLHADTNREAPLDGVQFCRRAGWSDAAIEGYRSRFGSFGKHIHALPESYRRLRDGQQIRLGEHDWRIITTGGHSPEHVSLYCPDMKLLISGDQVLPKISSNVSVFASEPEANPMQEWYESLGKLISVVPDDVLVLPSHNEPFYGLHERLEALKSGQDRALDRLLVSLAAGPQRIVDAFVPLFGRPIGERDAQQLSLATGEAMACMNYLIAQRVVKCAADENNIAWYSLAT
ncbi:MBL fold metallo-hydrolase [Burkholderia cepacia]|uniref:MBL fold metallo-hydrolase n=1 Tax=Burkholderia cepacia TaxID=292 RepID=UPI002652D3DC|nr:MBL fold metallo-hydrolase [Burkholderia cepacia]MDN7855350.1 MBL fold metallo-hydrolase [Burkholderia cepacia]